jgi:dipeptidyl aminopeptidase/acylaminoacyl peptidase
MSKYFQSDFLSTNRIILRLAACLMVLSLLAGCVSPGGGPAAQAEATAGIPVSTLTSTPLPSFTPTFTATPTETPVPTPHPLSMTAMRAREYPGSDLVIEQTLDPGSNYYRYIASYLSEGLKIFGLLTVPYAAAPEGGWPAIIFNHGYIPPDQYRTTERYVAYVNALATNGYVVFKPDYRGHGDSEGNASGAYTSPAYAIDVLNALASVQRFPGVNPDKMGMWGHSMGGNLTLRSMVTVKSIKVGVIWAGVVGSYQDMMTNWRRSGPVPTTGSRMSRMREELSDTYGSWDANPEFWTSLSPIDNVADISGPLQLHHGTADTEVPLEFSESLYQAMQNAGKEVELFTYPGDDHNISQSFSTAMQRTVQFFDRYLK